MEHKQTTPIPQDAIPDEEAIKGNARGTTDSPHYNDDLEATVTTGYIAHIKTYTSILNNYSKELEENLEYKRRSKKLLFGICILIMLATMVLLFISVIRGNASIEGCVEIVLPFLTIFIVIPKTITEYLFNANESETLTKIIDTIRQHDEKMIELTLSKQNDNKDT